MAIYYQGYPGSLCENADEILVNLDRCRELAEMRQSGLLEHVPDPGVGVLFPLE
jgi:hypothetical protein